MAEASWDSTVHDCQQLSRGGAADQRVFLTVRAVVQLSHPAEMQLVLRKRICVNLTGRQVSTSSGFDPLAGSDRILYVWNWDRLPAYV